MDRWRVGEDTGSKETDRCPLTGYVRNHASVICGAVDVVDGDRLGEGAHGDVIKLCPLDVNKTASGVAVNEGLSASSDCGIH
jgi:hypothetical protein